jgi:hypothetical protein
MPVSLVIADRCVDVRSMKRSMPDCREGSVSRGALEVGAGPLPGADLALETDMTIRALMTGELSPREAVKSGRVRLRGKRSLLERFVEVFHIPRSEPAAV